MFLAVWGSQLDPLRAPNLTESRPNLHQQLLNIQQSLTIDYLTSSISLLSRWCFVLSRLRRESRGLRLALSRCCLVFSSFVSIVYRCCLVLSRFVLLYLAFISCLSCFVALLAPKSLVQRVSGCLRVLTGLPETTKSNRISTESSSKDIKYLPNLIKSSSNNTTFSPIKNFNVASQILWVGGGPR